MIVDVIFLPDGTVNLVAPQQPGVSYEAAAPKLDAFAKSLSVELGQPVKVTQVSERHLHNPDGSHVESRVHRHA